MSAKFREKVPLELEEAQLVDLIRSMVRVYFRNLQRRKLSELESKWRKAFHDAMLSGKHFRFDERRFWKDLTGEPTT